MEFLEGTTNKRHRPALAREVEEWILSDESGPFSLKGSYPLVVEMGRIFAPKMNNDGPEFKSSLEERIERIKRLGNLRLYCLQRFYDGHSIAERYAQGWLELHLHITEDNTAPFCGRRRCLNSHRIIVGDDHEFIVFVEVAEFLKRLHPIASVVRLQPLDCCDMRLGQTLKVSTFPSIEVVCAAFDRKLCMFS